ncbi:tetratricopeptide repeat protein [Chryseobacterium schmidteae]|uniref:tetratricopeptide repeat protein n=1 Tax=Chryseobacterium schmidteae TaxID=2730404 RepID=UPI00158D306C|nr:hypothetical protein [Chryseobacterium schmidteae]
MIKNIVVIGILSLAVVSCKKKTAATDIKSSNDSIVDNRNTDFTYKPIDTICSKEYKSDDYIMSLEWYQKKIKINIAQNTPEQNNKLYLDYFKIRTKYTECLNVIHNNILDDYINYHIGFDSPPNLPDTVKKVAAELKKVNLEFRELGEGVTEIETIPSYYSSIFKGKVTPDFETYISGKDREGKENYAVDAGLLITWEELGERVIFWENFVKKYPNSSLIKTAKEDYSTYLSDYLFGMDKTSTYERYSEQPEKLYDENREEFNRIIKKYPNSNVAKKAKELMILFDAETPVEQIHKLINVD